MQEFVRRHKRRIWKHKRPYGERCLKWDRENQRQNRRSLKTNIGARGFFAPARYRRRTDKYWKKYFWSKKD